MPSNQSNRPRKNYEYIYLQAQMEQFEIENYIRNEPMIKKLFEEKEYPCLELARERQHRQKDTKKLQDDLKNLQDEKHGVEIQLAQANEKIRHISRNSSIQLLMSLAATVITAVGVNFITMASGDWTSWIILSAGIVLNIFAIGIAIRGK